MAKIKNTVDINVTQRGAQKAAQGIDQVTEHIIHDVFFDQPPKTVTASV